MAEGRRGEHGRIRLRGPDDMSPAERAEFEANPTARTNIARLFRVAEKLGPAIGAFNLVMATGITVPPLERELVTLAVLFLQRGEYEIAQHREVAKMMGIPEAKVQAVEEERYGDPMFSERERALLAFARQVVRSVRVDDLVYNAVAAFYDDRQIVELTVVIGNYMMLARITEVAELSVDGVQGASFWKDRLNGPGGD